MIRDWKVYRRSQSAARIQSVLHGQEGRALHRRHEASSVIQSGMRGCVVRSYIPDVHVMNAHLAAETLQGAVKGTADRRDYLEQEQEHMATLIQGAIKGGHLRMILQGSKQALLSLCLMFSIPRLHASSVSYFTLYFSRSRNTRQNTALMR